MKSGAVATIRMKTPNIIIRVIVEKITIHVFWLDDNSPRSQALEILRKIYHVDLLAHLRQRCF
jgi:hypothetical protein